LSLSFIGYHISKCGYYTMILF